MKRSLTYLCILALLVTMLTGCVEKKTFVRPEEPLLTGATVDQQKENSSEAQPEASGQESAVQTDGQPAEGTGTVSSDLFSLVGAVVNWDDASLMLIQIATDTGDWTFDLDPPSGKYVLIAFQFLNDTRLDSTRLSDMMIYENYVLVDGMTPITQIQQGVEIGDDVVYAVGTVNLFFDIPADKRLEDLVIEVKGIYSQPTTPGQEEEAPAEEPAPTGASGIEVTATTMAVPPSGELAYTPSDADGFFAVDGTLKAQTTIGISVDPPGIIDYDLSLRVEADTSVTCKIEVYKDGSLLGSYEQTEVELPAGDHTINCCIRTHEDTICSGSYTIRFYINGALIVESVQAL